MNFKGKIALVTGGGRGIGRAITHSLALYGADVIVADINEQDIGIVKQELDKSEQTVKALHLDVSDQNSVDKAVAQSIEQFGRIDVLINNAGVIGGPNWENRSKADDSDWNSTYDVNTHGIGRMIESVGPHMKSNDYGRIVNIASVAGRIGSVNSVPYAASKAAAISLTRSYAQLYAPDGITVNCIAPGLVWTKMWERIAVRRTTALTDDRGMSTRESFDAFVAQTTPLGRPQRPTDIANAVAFLASDLASGITGQTLNVDGGLTMD